MGPGLHHSSTPSLHHSVAPLPIPVMRVTHVITRLIVGGAQENTVASVLGLGRKPGLEVNLVSGPTAGPEGSLESMLEGPRGWLTIVPDLVRPLHPWKDARAWPLSFTPFPDLHLGGFRARWPMGCSGRPNVTQPG